MIYLQRSTTSFAAGSRVRAVSQRRKVGCDLTCIPQPATERLGESLESAPRTGSGMQQFPYLSNRKAPGPVMFRQHGAKMCGPAPAHFRRAASSSYCQSSRLRASARQRCGSTERFTESSVKGEAKRPTVLALYLSPPAKGALALSLPPMLSQ